MATKTKRKPQKQRPGGATKARGPARSKRSAKPPRKTVSARPKRGRAAKLKETNVRDAWKNLDHDFRQLELSGHALLKTVADLQDAAVDAYRSKLIKALVADQVLQDLNDACVASEEVSEEQLPESLQPFALLPHALAEWFERNLNVRRYSRRGQELEIPRERLSEFSVAGEIPGTLPALVRVRVTSEGWQLATETLVKPSVVLLVEAAASVRK